MARSRVRVAGHFGELLQGRLGPGGPVVLLTLPCPALGVRAVRVAAGAGLSLRGGLISPARARRFLGGLRLPLRGCVALFPEAVPGGGAGMSTATLMALARLAGWRGDPLRLARECVAAEGASDPLMLPEAAVLWASREGRVVRAMAPLEPCEIVGGFVGPPRRTDPGKEDFADISDLVAGWRGDLRVQAALAAQSAARRWGEAPAAVLVRELGALGWVAAHTGSAQGLIFAPGTVPDGAGAALRAAGFAGVLRFRAGVGA